MKPLRTQPPCPFLYDALGGRTHFAVAGVLDVAYEYDVRNRLVEILGNGKATRFDYDAAGQRTNAVWPNGTHAAYVYDDAGQLLSLIHGRANPPGEPLASFTYAYDLSGRRTNMVTLEGTNSYAYDARGQLTAVTYPDGISEAFAYDPVGNRTSLVQVASGGPAIETVYAYGPANRLLFSESAVETNVYVFDDAGRLVGQTVNGVSRTYGYDFQSRMTSMGDADGALFAYAFDGEGNRVRQDLNGCLTTRFVYDGANAVVEMNGSNEVVWAWVNGPGLDQPVERIAFINGEARNQQVIHADGLGSVSALTDESGETVQTYAYAAFGGIREQTGTDLNRVTFTAREALGDSLGLFYYRHRVYDPHTGRFTSEDPMGFIDGANRYVYCGNNPVNIVDPFGLAWYDNWHYEGRDAHNSNLPSSPEAADLAGGTLLSPEMSKYHDDPCTPGPEKKFIFPGGEEAVYNDETGQLVTDPRYKGTYNYVNPAPPSRNPLKWPGIVGRGAGHFFADMLPYYIWGNERPSEDESDHCK
jgi:RHS repeat-associated protein